MINNYTYILGLMDTINEWNEKLNNFVSGRMDNVAVGTVVIGVILVISVWGINELNKR